MCCYSEEVANATGVKPIADLCTFSLNAAVSADFFAEFQANMATDLDTHFGNSN